MEFCIGFVSSIVTKAAECMLSPIKNHVKYISNHAKNVQILKDRAERLKDARERVQHSVGAAKRNGEEIEHDVDKWLSIVDKKIREEVEKVMQDEEKAKKNCFIGLCPNPWTRYRHSLRAEEETDAVAELLERGTFERVSYRSAPQVGFMSVPVKGFEEFESRTLVLNRIMEALKEDDVSVIGVYGMGGIGKTTLVKQVARKVEGKLFDSVVIASVTQTLDVKEIQHQIADLLGLKFEEQSIVGRAHRLRERLSKENKILVVLDDIWAKLDIGEVGIPFGDEHKGCKILLTSRELNVLSNGMDTQKNFPVGVLNEKEAWDLFKKMAGDCVEISDLQPTAMEVAKKCAGLPIAIATVASALRNKSKFEWKNALRELNTPSSSNLTGITAAYSAIEWSYNYLESEEVKMTFLLCSLIGHNGSVEDLVRYTLGLGLFGGVNTIEDYRNKILTVVANLKASCLLLDSYNDKRFDIHDVVWDAALTIASRDGHMLVLRDHVPKEWFNKEKMHNWSVISLRSPHIIAELPKEIECLGLSFFHMAHNGSVNIPGCFFRQTKSLKVLDFFGIQFLSLRESICYLTDLRMLCLRKCALEDITIIKELKNLEILSLAESDIKALPLEIAQLSRLKLLDLSRCSKLKVIPPNVLSSLSKLEELYMERSFDEWEDGGVVGNERRNASLDELNNLPRLTTLYAHIPNAEMIPKHQFVETLDRYRIIIGDDKVWDWSKDLNFSRTLAFKLHKNIYFGNGVKMLLKKTEDLYLEGLEGIKNVLFELNNGEGFPYLKRLNVKNGIEVQYITMENLDFSKLRSISLNDMPQLISFCSQDERCSTSSEPSPLFNKQFAFPSLESLQLSFINAKSIWNNQTYYWVCNLTELIIKDCPNLEHLLSPSMARNLMHLQRFKIVNCESLREIIFTEEIEEEKKDVICFPRLNSLHISGLQNLIIFCSGNYNIEFPLLKELNIDNCPNLKEFISQTSDQSGKHALFNEKAALPSLERMTISHLRNVKMIFPNELLAPGWIFHCLENLKVTNCDSLEQIFELGGLNTKELHAVDSQQSPKLKHVWNKDPQEIPPFQNLRKVRVWDCYNLKNVFPASIAKDLPKLEDLSICDCGVEEIVSVVEGVDEPVRFKFPQVSSLEFTNLKKLKPFYEGQHTIVWPKLKTLKTDYSTLPKILALECLGIQETNGNNQPESTIGQSVSLVEEVIPKLEELGLHNLGDVDQFPPDLFHRIKVFKVFGSHGGSSIFLFLQRFYNLKSLELSDFDFKDEVPCKAYAGTLTRIRNLTLNNSNNLKHLWKKDSELDRILSNLETLNVSCCDDLINIEPLSFSFQNLTTLNVFGCKMMTNLLTPSVVQNLVQLTTLSVVCCSAMTEIVTNEGDGATYHQTLVLGKLKCLKLIGLESLTSFCPGDYTFNFPYLEELAVEYCPRLNIFSQGVLSTPKLQCVKETRFHQEGRWAGDLNTTIQQMYIEKVGSDDVYELKLSDTIPDLMEMWNRRNPREILGFKWLGSVEFCNCSSLKYIFTPSMLLSFNQLDHLIVKECNSMEEVINEEEDEATRHKLTYRPLRKIEIESCHNLTRFYMGSEALEFPELHSIKIADCPKMNAFCSSISREKSGDAVEKGIGELDIQHNSTPFFNNQGLCPRLYKLTIAGMRDCTKIWPYQLAVNSFCKLWELNIQNCASLEEIIEPKGLVANESDAVTAATKFALPELTYLGLDKLPELKRFCSRMHTTQWPSLKRMDVIECPKVVIFAPCGETQTESRDGISNKNALFCVNEDTFPVLEELRLKQNDMMKGICQGQLSLECFKELKSLNLQCFPETSTTFPYRFIQSLPNLEKLLINNGSNCQIVQPQVLGNEERYTLAFTRIKELRLSKLLELTLKTLEPYLQSFKNLTTLEVSSCNGFINLMASTTVKSLMVLKRMTITECEMIEEIIACEGEEIQGSIVFPKLKYLQLSCLPNLASFSLGDLAFEFPVLQTVIVSKCKNMRSFCQGDLSNVPRFHLTRDDEDRLWWEGDLNATIKHMFDETNVQI